MFKNEIDEDKRIELANYLNNVKEDRKLGHNQLAAQAGVDASVLHRMLNGQVKKVNPFHLRSIAEALRIDYKILYQIVGYIDSTDMKNLPNDKLTKVELNQKIPVYSKVHAGPDGYLEYGEVLEYITIPRLRNGTEVVGIKVDGDSMEHTIPDGATVLVKKDVEVAHNEIGVFIYNNNPLVKRLKQQKGIMMLLSDNNSYDPIIIEDYDDFFVIGKVVEVMYKL